MPNTTRITNTGNLLVNGSFDEFTGAPVINSNVVLWLDAGQTASYSGTGNTWTDLSTNALNGTLVNSPTFTSSPANIRFNGTNQRVTFAANSAVQFLNTSPYTLEAWIYPTQIPPSSVYQGIIDRESNPGTGRDGWNFWLQGNSQASNTTVAFGSERFGLGVQNSASTSVTAVSTIGVWQHMVSTYDGTTIRIYRNGVQLTTGTSNVNITNTTQTVGLASRSGAGSFFYGSISAVKIYNRALSASEILQNYNALAGRYGLAANTSGTAIQRTTSNTVLAEQFDEVTYNTASPTIKNLYQYTQDFTNAYWVKSSSVTVANTAATLAPDGSSTAQIATVGGTGLYPYIRVAPGGAVVPVTVGTTYTVSAYVKYINQRYMNIVNEDGWTGGMAATFDLANVTASVSANVAAATITSVGNGWYRIAATYVPVPSGITYWNPQPIRIGRYDGTNYSSSQVYIWGAQLEASSAPTIYQPIAATNTLVTTGMAQRVDNSGTMYVSGNFDEVTGF